jgi:hypothetical protein
MFAVRKSDNGGNNATCPLNPAAFNPSHAKHPLARKAPLGASRCVRVRVCSARGMPICLVRLPFAAPCSGTASSVPSPPRSRCCRRWPTSTSGTTRSPESSPPRSGPTPSVSLRCAPAAAPRPTARTRTHTRTRSLMFVGTANGYSPAPSGRTRNRSEGAGYIVTRLMRWPTASIVPPSWFADTSLRRTTGARTHQRKATTWPVGLGWCMCSLWLVPQHHHRSTACAALPHMQYPHSPAPTAPAPYCSTRPRGRIAATRETGAQELEVGELAELGRQRAGEGVRVYGPAARDYR